MRLKRVLSGTDVHFCGFARAQVDEDEEEREKNEKRKATASDENK